MQNIIDEIRRYNKLKMIADDESLDTFKDVKQWEEYWMDKFYKLTTKKNTSGYFYAAV
ncbi:hypothetical protein [Campylobacter concisus]|uniref:hypothetical protein n=1 Tax=Campylobacter concisus TaxID=199 RepID=UPI0015E15C21|nr:hypothetical protein [Campylobacter concisus]